MDNALLGRILLDFQLVHEADLERCLEMQRTMAQPKRLGEILLEQGLLDPKTLASILSVQRHKLAGREGQPAPDLGARLSTADAAGFLAAARELGASDLYLSACRVPLVNLRGGLVELPAPPLTPERCRELLLPLMTQAQLALLERHCHVDFQVVVPDHGSFRANVFPHLDGLGAVFRILPTEIRRLETLGLPDAVRQAVEAKSGLILITGPASSGKTTTMTALIDHINRYHRWHVIMLEHPLECALESQRALITQREIGTHSASHATALRAALREDPDVIVVGDLRDFETTQIALTAAETGHLVLGTLHTRSAHSTIVRIIDQFTDDKRDHVRTMLSAALRAVVCQELVPSPDGRSCTLAAEVMLASPAIRNLIRENRIWQIPMVMQTNAHAGMQLMDDALAELVRVKKITVEEALARATDESKLAVA